jgi:creatinine amidohydrolase
MMDRYTPSYELTMDVYSDLAKKSRKAILPLGAQEAHSYHLPLDTDSIIAYELAKEASRLTGTVLLPLLSYGHVKGLKNFPGSISLSINTLKRIILEIAESVQKDGIKKLYVINGNIPNSPAIDLASEEAHSSVKIYNVTFPDASEVYEKLCESRQWHPGMFHAEEIETSLILYLRPELVKIEKSKPSYPEKPKDFGLRYIPWEEFNESGVIGDPTKASAEKGKRIFEFFLKRIVDLISST